MFSLNIGMAGMGGILGQSRDVIDLLTTATFGEEPNAGNARQEIIENHPGLLDLPAAERGNTLAYRVYYEGLCSTPTMWNQGMAISALICALPGLLGITFGSKLLNQRRSVWRILLAYGEFMLLTIVLAFVFFLQTVVTYIAPDAGLPPLGLVRNYVRQFFVYGFMAFMATMIYRGKLFRGRRALLYGLFVLCCIFF